MGNPQHPAPCQVNEPRGGRPWVWTEDQGKPDWSERRLRGGKMRRKCGRRGVLGLEQSRLPNGEDASPRERAPSSSSGSLSSAAQSCALRPSSRLPCCD